MLEDLYFAVAGVLEGDVPSSSRADEIRAEARVGFVGDASEPSLLAFLRDMPDRYVLATPVDAIRAHARAARDRNGRLVHVAKSPGPTEEISELLVATDDRPGLLADITAVLASQRLSVVSAQIYTRPREGAAPEAFDVFHVRREGAEGDPVDERLLARIQKELLAVLEGRSSSEDLMGRIAAPPTWAVRRIPDVPTEVTVDNAISPRFTVVDVLTRDRIGLLHAIAKALHDEGLSIAISKVGTEGARATDVFYVQKDGSKVDDGELGHVKAHLLDVLARYHARFDQG
jgi:[protein-PII] uridylyltransferase